MHKHRDFRITLRALVFLITAFSLVSVNAAENIYRLAPGDRVKVVVFGHEDLSGEFDVDNGGSLSLPLIKSIAAAGFTVQEIEEAITVKLKPDYLKNPRVSVLVLEYRPIYILGEVKNPGSYPYSSNMAVVTAVALAGGYTYRAKEKSITIVRAKDPSHEKIPANSNTPVLPGDVIEVPERFF
jgi:protein involved in polysaccharide export with SLBB domain